MRDLLPPNHCAGVDAGLAALFAFAHHWPGTTQHDRSAEMSILR